MNFRVEKDSMGEVKVPADAYFGVQSTRSMNNFPISGFRLPPEQVEALVNIKAACAMANMELGILDAKKGNAIVRACREIAKGSLRDQFVVDIFQAGSGTSSNMNTNEVIANRAAEMLGGKRGDRGLVHPNDDVNMGQSTNNVFPTSIRVASIPLLKRLAAEAKGFHRILKKKEKEFDRVLKSGRTHLQDAVPVRMGQVFGAFARSIEKDIERLVSKIPYVSELGVGGNAVGTGINTDPKFRSLIIKHLNAETGEKFRVTKNGIEATHSTNDLADLSSAVNTLATDIHRICNDLRLMSSGPKTGLNEIVLPAVEPGSSIMPGKINPTIPEAINMVCLKVFGNHQTVSLSAASAQLELNVTMPVTGYALIESLKILASGIKVLGEKCVDGIKVNKEVCERYAMQSPSIATFLNPVIGYDRASAVVKKALKENKTIPEVVLEEKLLSKAELDRILDPKKLTAPSRVAKRKK